MSTRITRSPKAKVDSNQAANGAKGTKGTKGKKDLITPKQAKAGFESHSGRDVLLGEKATSTTSESLIRESPTKGALTGDAKGMTKGAKGTKSAKGDPKGLVAGDAAAKGDAKDGLSAKGDAKGLSPDAKAAKAGVEAKAASKGEGQTEVTSKEAKKGLLGGLKQQMTGIFQAAKDKASSVKSAALATQISTAQVETKGAALAQTAKAAGGQAEGAAGAGTAQGGAAPGGAATTEGSAAGKAASGLAQSPADGKAADGKSAMAGNAQSAGQPGATQAKPGTQTARGAAQAYQGDAGQLGSSAHSSAQTGHKSSTSKAVSLRSLHFQEVKADAKVQDNRVDSPRQQFRALLKQWATATEFAVLQQGHGFTANDAASVAQRIAVLAQNGQLPVNDLLSMLVKILKQPGNQKKLAKIKEVLIKKGVISAGISTETLELIAAMIALYLAKGGNESAEMLIGDLFSSSSKRLELPDGAGEHHQEGREQEGHAEHQRGETIDLDGYLSGL